MHKYYMRAQCFSLRGKIFNISKVVFISALMFLLSGFFIANTVLAEDPAPAPQMQAISPLGVITGDTWNVLTGTVDFVFDFHDAEGDIAYLEFDIMGPAPYNVHADRIQVTFAANETDPQFGWSDAAKALAIEMGVSAVYSAAEEKWTITVNTDAIWPDPTINPWGQASGDPVWPAGQYHFYIEVGDLAGNQWGDMMPPPSYAQYLYYFHSIQTAIDTASPGDTINVAAGTYTEYSVEPTTSLRYNVNVNKQLTLVGDPTMVDMPIVDTGGATKSVAFWINADNVTLSGFDSKNASVDDAVGGSAVYIVSNNNTVENNQVSGSTYGILVSGSSNTFNDNVVKNNTDGIVVVQLSANNNTFEGNDIYNNTGDGIRMEMMAGAGNTFNLNNIHNNGFGMRNNRIAEAIDAERNWWGSENGPEHVGNTFNIGNQGDKVSDNINFTPWLDNVYPMDISFAPVENLETNEMFSSIQAAIDAASAYDTILVHPGTYNEILVVNKPLTLQGENRETTIIDGAGAGHTIDIKADNITVQGFTIKNGSPNNILMNDSGNSYNLELRDNIIKDATGEGVFLKQNHASDNVEVTIRNNIFGANGGDNLWLEDTLFANIHYGSYNFHPYDRWIVINNTFNPCGPAPGLDFAGLGLTNVIGALVLNNDFNTYWGVWMQGSMYVEIKGNQINYTFGDGGTGIVLWTVDGDNPTKYVVILDNHIQGFKANNWPPEDGKGIVIGGAEYVWIQNNTIEDNTIGIWINDDYTNCNGARINNVGDPSNINLHHNNIYDNTEYGVYNHLGVLIDATNNWWGDFSGPSGFGSGTGDAVSAYVVYEPWLRVDKDSTDTYYEINIITGWNLISIPTIPADTNISKVLENTTDIIVSVWTYDAINNEWYVYNPGNPDASNLSTMTAGYGYWIDATNDGVIKGYGNLFHEQQTPPQRQLVSGWNLIGYYQKDRHSSGIPVNYALAILSDHLMNPMTKWWTSLISYDNTEKSFVEVGFHDFIYPGNGFWILMKSSTMPYIYGPGESFEGYMWPGGGGFGGIPVPSND